MNPTQSLLAPSSPAGSRPFQNVDHTTNSSDRKAQITRKITDCLDLLKNHTPHRSDKVNFSIDIMNIKIYGQHYYDQDIATTQALSSKDLLSYFLVIIRYNYLKTNLTCHDLDIIQKKLEDTISTAEKEDKTATIISKKWPILNLPAIKKHTILHPIVCKTYTQLLNKVIHLTKSWPKDYELSISRFSFLEEPLQQSRFTKLASPFFLSHFSTLDPCLIIPLLFKLRLTTHFFHDLDLSKKKLKEYSLILSQPTHDPNHKNNLQLILGQVYNSSSPGEKIKEYDIFFQSLAQTLLKRENIFSSQLFLNILPKTSLDFFKEWLFSCSQEILDIKDTVAFPQFKESCKLSLNLLQQYLEMLAIQIFVMQIDDKSPQHIIDSCSQALQDSFLETPIKSISDLKTYVDKSIIPLNPLHSSQILRDYQKFHNKIQGVFKKHIGSFTFMLNDLFEIIFSGSDSDPATSYKVCLKTISVFCGDPDTDVMRDITDFHEQKKRALTLIEDKDTQDYIKLLHYFSFKEFSNILPINGTDEIIKACIEFYEFKQTLNFPKGPYQEELDTSHYPIKSLKDLQDLNNRFKDAQERQKVEEELLKELDTKLSDTNTNPNKKKKKKKKKEKKEKTNPPTDHAQLTKDSIDRNKTTANWISAKQILHTIANEHLLLLTSDTSFTELFQSIKANLGSSDDSLRKIDLKNRKMSNSDLSTSLTNIKNLTEDLLKDVYRSYYDKIQTFISQYPSDGLDIVNYSLTRIIFEHPITNFTDKCILPETFNLLRNDINTLKYFFSSCNTLLANVNAYRDLYHLLCYCSDISSSTGYPSELTIPSFEDLLKTLLIKLEFCYQGNQCLTLHSLKLLDHDSLDSNIPKLKNLLSRFITTYLEQVNTMITYLTKLSDDPYKLLDIQSKLSDINDPETQQPIDFQAIIRQEIDQLTSFVETFQHYPNQEYNKEMLQCFKLAYIVRENSFKSITSR